MMSFFFYVLQAKFPKWDNKDLNELLQADLCIKNVIAK